MNYEYLYIISALILVWRNFSLRKKLVIASDEVQVLGGLFDAMKNGHEKNWDELTSEVTKAKEDYQDILTDNARLIKLTYRAFDKNTEISNELSLLRHDYTNMTELATLTLFKESNKWK